MCGCTPERSEQNPYADLFRTSPITELKNYKDPRSSWESRVFPLDDHSKSFVEALNRIDGFENSPVASTDLADLSRKLSKVRKRIPTRIDKLLNEQLFGIIVCENLGGTAVSGIVYEKEIPKGGFVILDSKVLRRKANDWITFKENSPFQNGKISVRIRIEEPSEDTEAAALEYILLHEFGHILAVTSGTGPDLRDRTRKFSDRPFYQSVWRSENKSFEDGGRFRTLRKVRFYTSEFSLDKEWKNVYPILADSPFPTLYSASNADDFFAESFVSYVHVLMEKRPWTLTVHESEKILYEMNNGIEKDSLKEQRKILRRLLEDRNVSPP
ncbi:hypothetical protein EHO60_10700 [Leptospira fletcheri]|uniref:Lipoprotein n=1 Tax=Leptospira fletcheri TaxID=2484981 RepID=A0A4V3JDK6_9LEPT|nr:hypothetical protein EHO60_10700 [Leptospira fletcheri]